LLILRKVGDRSVGEERWGQGKRILTASVSVSISIKPRKIDPDSDTDPDPDEALGTGKENFIGVGVGIGKRVCGCGSVWGERENAEKLRTEEKIQASASNFQNPDGVTMSIPSTRPRSVKSLSPDMIA